MILGVGVDVVEVARIEQAMTNPRFRNRILTEAERKECQTAVRVAGRWAAKEAIAKALGISMSWQDLEISSVGGPPEVRVLTSAVDTRRLRIHLSITHERNLAVAMAVVESD